MGDGGAVLFTDVAGNKYWYALHVPVQQPGSFEEFQAKLRREMAGQRLCDRDATSEC